ncbi:hypothetical protein PanWU01x14_326910 [Parasponia andersonii]|uniref:Uncharacterized protein n=1 Tax=Parasponia andersonii TaxID=3476 RepID=A0A2P5AJ88_PARAD|nr:hypothetical protein PanWU01x14_326910 [Parasponia andersonii]
MLRLYKASSVLMEYLHPKHNLKIYKLELKLISTTVKRGPNKT